MKLRVRNNSLRLRLLRSEVAALGETGKVTEVVELGPEPHQRLIYTLEKCPGSDSLNAVINGGDITIRVPQEQADAWCGTELVGLESEQDIGRGKLLRILVEKDFKCLEPRPGDEDAFPHPGGDRSC